MRSGGQRTPQTLALRFCCPLSLLSRVPAAATALALGALLSTLKTPGQVCSPGSPSADITADTRLQCSDQPLRKLFQEQHRPWWEPGLLELQRSCSSSSLGSP